MPFFWIPTGAENNDHSTPWINRLIIFICCAVFFYGLFLSESELKAYENDFLFVSASYFSSVDPHYFFLRPFVLFKDIFSIPFLGWKQIFTSTFMHEDFIHLAGNMWFLWIFGKNVEHFMGHIRYLLFFILSGVFSEIFQTLIAGPTSLQSLGASGSIATVIGAYAVFFPSVRINIFFGFVDHYGPRVVAERGDLGLKAKTFFVIFLLLQFIYGIFSLGQEYATIAFWAHVGGLIFGLCLARYFKDPYVLSMKESENLLKTPEEKKRSLDFWSKN